jgi:hypothetical protein
MSLRSRLLLLGTAGREAFLIDVEEKALVRTTLPDPLAARRFSLIEARLSPSLDGDPLYPERRELSGVPDVVGEVRGRRLRRLLSRVAVPLGPREEPLPFAGPSAYYPDLEPDGPSVALAQVSELEILGGMPPKAVLRSGKATALLECLDPVIKHSGKPVSGGAPRDKGGTALVALSVPEAAFVRKLLVALLR